MPRKKWLQDMEQDVGRMGLRGRNRKESVRDERRKIVEEAKADKGLQQSANNKKSISTKAKTRIYVMTLTRCLFLH